MPAGGKWTVQNKRRPGAYLNFVAVPKAVSVVGDRGVVAIALPMTWGPLDKLIELTGAELLNGDSVVKVGYSAFDTAESLPYRLALSGCYKALLFRTDAGGTKATKVLSAGSLTANAKYTGTTGNNLSIAITQDKPTAGKYTVDVLFKSAIKESFVVAALADFKAIDSDWVDFVVADNPTSTTIPVPTGDALATGTNGTVSAGVYTTFFSLLEHEDWQCLALNSSDTTVMDDVAAYIALLRDNRGRKVQGVVYNYETDTEGCIYCDQGFQTDTDNVTVDLFPLWVASITAGAAVNQSNTARVVENAIKIINPVAEDEIEGKLALGHFLLSYRQDGAVVVEKDINSLHTFTADKGYAFSKNRVIRCLDGMANTTALTFSKNYAGKITNDSVGRNLFKTELISIMDTLQDIGAIKNFDGSKDISILPGEAVDAIVVDLTVQPTDSMEKLYMTVEVDA
jgi:hypothetical protein